MDDMDDRITDVRDERIAAISEELRTIRILVFVICILVLLIAVKLKVFYWQ